MTKITFVGAGSLVFTRNLCSDVLLSPALQDCTISLMDIDSERLCPSRDAVRSIVDRRGIKAHVEATTDREEALRDADYVVTTFQQGGLEAYEMDVQIPRRYGIEQCVGDTLGPGGVFRALRTIPVLLDLCREIEDLAPDALLLNYVNPMAANCWAVDLATGRPCVGLCHSVQDTSEMLAEWVDVPYEEMVYFCAGINHQAFFLKLRRGGEDLYPRVKKAVGREEIRGREPVRIDIMENFGFFVTESSGHASEYMPYFRKNARMVEEELVPRFTDERNHWYDFGRTGGYLRHCLDRLEESREEYAELRASGGTEPPTARTHEYGSYIIEAIEKNTSIRVNANVPNHGLIRNLPDGCCVEVPCLVDGNGIQPTTVDRYPTQLAALNRTNVNVQELTVGAAVSGDLEAVHHAVMLDPLTSSVCTLPQARAMVDEMLEAQARWLPQFREGLKV
jgi:alpha-galactosidase